jgi:general secretion pathway protein G
VKTGQSEGSSRWPCELAQLRGFSARVAPAEKAEGRDQDKAQLDEKLAAVEPVDRVTLQAGSREQTMEEQGGGGEVDGEMKGFPKAAAQSKAPIRSKHYQSQEIEGDGADGVFQRLAGRMDRVEEIHEAKARVFVQQQDGRMQKRNGKSDIAGPVVQAEVVEPAMWPGTMGAVAEGHEDAQERVQRDGADAHKAEVGRDIEDSYAHGRQEPSIGFETARTALTFRRVLCWFPKRAEMKLRPRSATSIVLVVCGLLALVLLATPGETARVSRREREAILRTDLRTIRDAIDNYTLDKQRPPKSLQDLVDAGYLRTIPIDPITGRPDCVLDFDGPTLPDPVVSPDLVAEGFHDVHSNSRLVDRSGSAYNRW